MREKKGVAGDYNAKKMRDNPTQRMSDRETIDAALAGAEFELDPFPVGTVMTLPMVAVGTSPPASFMARAVAERSAKPTEGGLYLNTE